MLMVKKLHPDAKKPVRAYPNDLGMDVFTTENFLLHPGQKHNFKTGIACALPDGKGAFIWDKSGIGNKSIKTLGGVIEGTYRAEWEIILINLGDEPVPFVCGQKVAQVVILDVDLCGADWVDELPESDRGTKGYGSSGNF
jgi:dUTP pyrophosphatase